MRRLALEFVPALDGPLFQFVITADDVEPAALALEDRQRQPPEPFLADHPVVHVLQPVQLLILSPLRNPADLLDDLHDLTPPGHVDIPFIHRSEQKRRPAPPAVRVIVLEFFLFIIDIFLPQVFQHLIGHLRGGLTRQKAVAIYIHAALVDRHEDRQFLFLAQVEVFLAAARGDMHDPGSVAVGDFLPGDNAMGIVRVAEGTLDFVQFIERPGIFPADHFRSLDRALDGEFALLLHNAGQRLGHVIQIAVLAGFGVVQFRIDRRRHIGRQRPGRGRPDQQVFPLPAHQRKLHEHGGIFDVLIPFPPLLFGDAGLAAGTPGHGVQPLVDQPLLVALFEERPDGVVVLVAHGVIAVVPVHPVA
ncbi:MAG: hypothetical protein BWY71_01558 [Planctomycetes bacterium ADurb.Bin412]|nr:MAG: hypothetical protein BWY71_01558 [Planctomycetes bacterium ADurb.Bin412]